MTGRFLGPQMPGNFAMSVKPPTLKDIIVALVVLLLFIIYAFYNQIMWVKEHFVGVLVVLIIVVILSGYLLYHSGGSV